jgi:hypothetical protein
MTWHTLYPHNGRAFRLPCGCVNITVHRWDGKGDWWLTCVEADYVAYRLDTEDVERAKNLAVEMVRKRLQEALDVLNEGGE